MMGVSKKPVCSGPSSASMTGRISAKPSAVAWLAIAAKKSRAQSPFRTSSTPLLMPATLFRWARAFSKSLSPLVASHQSA